jgi:hypothetical protein
MEEILAFRIINELKKKGLIGDYAIAGGVAYIYYDEPITTEDIDVFCMLGSEVDALSAIYSYAGELGFKPEKEGIRIGSWRVQFLPSPTDLEQDAIRTANKVKAGGITTRIVKPEYLAALMLKAGRTKDIIRVDSLIERGGLDKDKLYRIIERYGLDDKWLDFKRRGKR